jgi:octaprenyl-diphosphate synthase
LSDTSHSSQYEDLRDFAGRTRADIEDALNIRISGRSDGEVLKKMLSSGKKLRPVLSVLSFKACGGRAEDYPKALDVSAAVELGHSASLCHDDIVDRDLTRRGHRAIWVEEGIPEALIAGHRAVSLAFIISLAHGTEIAQTFLRAWDLALRGGELEAQARRNGTINPGEYFEILRCKTASLFAAATKAGAQVAGAPPGLQKVMEEYGNAVGVTYQLADDLSELDEKKAGEISSVVGWSKVSYATLKEFLKQKVSFNIVEAEALARDPTIPEGVYKQFLEEVPRYFVARILAGKMPLLD